MVSARSWFRFSTLSLQADSLRAIGILIRWSKGWISWPFRCCWGAAWMRISSASRVLVMGRLLAIGGKGRRYSPHGWDATGQTSVRLQDRADDRHQAGRPFLHVEAGARLENVRISTRTAAL